MAENTEVNNENAQIGEVLPVVEQQAETNKQVKAQVKKAAKPKSAKGKAQSEAKPIAAASNPGRPDVKYIEKGDLIEPVE